jgi:inositol phosphorylceramide mannosyltransferase catalytic subunit
MEISFISYIIFTMVIVAIIFIVILRYKNIANYQDQYLTNGTEDLKYIPKKIFQLVADKNKISPDFQKNIEYIKNLNPDWEYRLFDDQDMEDYILKNYGYSFLRYYNKINPKYGASRADFFRYLLMYKEGGAYFDIKSATKYPLNRIILPNDEYILSYWDFPVKDSYVDHNMGEFQQWHIICRPNHPFLYAVINDVIKNIDNYSTSVGVGKLAVLKVTGPIAYTKAILPILDKYNHRIIGMNEFVGLIYNNLPSSHINLFSKTHYSKITEPVIIK